MAAHEHDSDGNGGPGDSGLPLLQYIFTASPQILSVFIVFLTLLRGCSAGEKAAAATEVRGCVSVGARVSES